MTNHSRTTRTAVLGLALLLVAGCGGSSGEELITNPPPEPYHIERGSGNEQVARIGTILPDSVVVTGPAGMIHPDVRSGLVTIEWTVSSGGGSVAEVTTQIDALAEEPRSGNVWVLGPEPGPQTLRAQVAGGASYVTFFATATD